jgi:hypothetical protein
MCPGPSSWEYLIWRAFVGSGRLGSGCLVLRAYTRENPVGKNGVMTFPLFAKPRFVGFNYVQMSQIWLSNVPKMANAILTSFGFDQTLYFTVPHLCIF